jgi:hypothetical protein
MAAIALAVFARSKRSAQQLIATLGAFLAVVVNALYLPVLAAVAAAIVFPEASRTRAGGTALGAVTVLIGVYAIALAVVAPRHSAATAPFEDESLLLSAARTHHAHRLVCTRVVWCDEGLEHGPAVYADDRFDAEPWQAYNDVFAMRYMLNGWPESMRRARPDAFIAGRDEPPVQILGTTPGWHTIVCTTTACLLMRATDS